MKTFNEFSHSNGTYACLTPDAESNEKLVMLSRSLGLEIRDDYHCTVTYSKRPCPSIEQLSPALPIMAVVVRADIFPTKDENSCLVLRLMSSDIHELFKQCQMHGASYDYDD